MSELLSQIQRDLYAFTANEREELFEPLMHFWVEANHKALSAAVTHSDGLKVIVDVPSAHLIGRLVNRLLVLADTVLIRDVANPPGAAEEAYTQLVPTDDYRPGHLDSTIGELRKIAPSPLTIGRTPGYWTSTEERLNNGHTAHFMVSMAGCAPPSGLAEWLYGPGQEYLETGQVCYAPFVPPLDVELGFVSSNVDMASYFGAQSFFHQNSEWLSEAMVQALLTLQLPFLENVDATNLRKVKTDLRPEFLDFRKSMMDAMREVTGCIGSATFASDVRHIQEDILDTGLRKVEQATKRVAAMKALRAKQATVCVVGLSVGACALGATPLALGAGVTAVLSKLVANKRESLREAGDLREMEHYFLWTFKE